MPADAALIGPGEDRIGGQLGAVVADDRSRLARLDNEPAQLSPGFDTSFVSSSRSSEKRRTIAALSPTVHRAGNAVVGHQSLELSTGVLAALILVVR